MAQASETKSRVINPFALIKKLWPDIKLYQQQKDIVQSVWLNRETVVVAGNMLGKDFVSALVALVFFLTRRKARVVSTSVDAPQLEKVLWGEIKRLINTSVMELPLKVNHLDIRKLNNSGKEIDLTYLIGRTAKEPEGLLGHHLPWGDSIGQEPATLMLYDEASSIPDNLFAVTETWRHRMLCIGNPYPTTNYFYQAVKDGTDATKSGKGIFRNVISITAEDSPNVRRAREEQKAGKEPSGTIIIEGLKTWDEYQLNRAKWDERKQHVQLDAKFWEGADVRMFTDHMITLAIEYAQQLEKDRVERKAKAIGCDTAEGGDDTVWAVSDELGLIEMISMKTTKTDLIADMTIQLMRTHKVPASKVLFDRGGGGKQHADYLARLGHRVKTLSFGGTIKLEPKRTTESYRNKKEVDEERTEYVNNRARLYGMARDQMNPDLGNRIAIPERFAYGENNSGIVDQIRLIPLLYDNRGRMKLIAKGQRPGALVNDRKPTDEPTFQSLIGRSPDQADAWTLSMYPIHSRRSTLSPGAF